MLNGDVPLFTINTSNNVLSNSRRTVISFDQESTILDEVRVKVIGMDQKDKEKQIKMINMSFIGSGLIEHKWEERRKIQSKCKKSRMYKGLDIKESIIKNSFENEREMGWIGLRSLTSKYYDIFPIGYDLYQGATGIALALSLYDKNDYRIKKVLKYSESYLEKYAGEIHLGAFDGLAGYIYCLTMIESFGVHLEESAEKVVWRYLDEFNIDYSKYKPFDIISGKAGILGCLISIGEYYKGKNKDIYYKCKEITQNIYNDLKDFSKENIMNFERSNIEVLGYAHGLLGVIVQLVRYEIVNNKDISNDMLSQIEHYLFIERTKFDEKLKKYKLRDNAIYQSWCNGIAGMLFGKKYLVDCGYKDQYINDEIERLSCELYNNSSSLLDASLCHGTVGINLILKYVQDAYDISDKNQLSISKYYCRNSFLDYDHWGLMAGEAGLLLSKVNNSHVIFKKILLLEGDFYES
ncbi:lanthionine synthetase LanC family protein [Staphylococcus simulans]